MHDHDGIDNSIYDEESQKKQECFLLLYMSMLLSLAALCCTGPVCMVRSGRSRSGAEILIRSGVECASQHAVELGSFPIQHHLLKRDAHTGYYR